MMASNGLVKLIEELGELGIELNTLIQVCAKKIALGENTWSHWDGTDLKERLENEIGDVRAACSFVARNFELDYDRMADRYDSKCELFTYWHHGGTEITIPQEQQK